MKHLHGVCTDAVGKTPAVSGNDPPCQDQLGHGCPPSAGHPTTPYGHSLFPQGRLPVRWMAIESLNYSVYTTKSDV